MARCGCGSKATQNVKSVDLAARPKKDGQDLSAKVKGGATPKKMPGNPK